MADQKITDMTPASLPLDGTEIVPLVQGGANVKALLNSVSTVNRAYGVFRSDLDQSDGVNTATAMTFDITEFAVDVSIVDNSKITVDRDGKYNIQFSAQLINTDSGEHNVSIWLSLNGTNVEGTCTDITVPKKQGGINGASVAAWNFFVDMEADDYVELYWSTPNAGVKIDYIAARTTPDRPSVPSIILTVNQVQ